MRTCSTCKHWIKNQQYNLGACGHPNRLVHIGEQVALPIMFAYQNCERHEQRQEEQKGK